MEGMSDLLDIAMRSASKRSVILTLLVLLPLAACISSHDSSQSVTWLADGMLSPHPIADPRAPFTGSRVQKHGGGMKNENAFGAEQSIYRVRDGERAFEVGIEAAAISRFDFEEDLDMDGVDYRVGFPIVWRRGDAAFKFEPWHLTSHLGDEIIERTGRRRIDYARDALLLGAAFDLDETWRVYGEVDFAIRVGSLNERWRAMGGVEWFQPLPESETCQLYAALNTTSFQESDWILNFNLQAGLWFRPKGSHSSIRIGLEYYNGRSALTQFFREREEHVGFGFWLHL